MTDLRLVRPDQRSTTTDVEDVEPAGEGRYSVRLTLHVSADNPEQAAERAMVFRDLACDFPEGLLGHPRLPWWWHLHGPYGC